MPSATRCERWPSSERSSGASRRVVDRCTLRLVPMVEGTPADVLSAAESAFIVRRAWWGAAKSPGLRMLWAYRRPPRRACVNPPKGRDTFPRHEECAVRLRAKSPAGRDRAAVAVSERLPDSVTRGDPIGLLPWPSSSAARPRGALRDRADELSECSGNCRPYDLGYSLQVNRKTREGRRYLHRNMQWNVINRRVKASQWHRRTLVTVNTNALHSANPERVRVHDIPDVGLGPSSSRSAPRSRNACLMKEVLFV